MASVDRVVLWLGCGHSQGGPSSKWIGTFGWGKETTGSDPITMIQQLGCSRSRYGWYICGWASMIHGCMIELHVCIWLYWWIVEYDICISHCWTGYIVIVVLFWETESRLPSNDRCGDVCLHLNNDNDLVYLKYPCILWLDYVICDYCYTALGGWASTSGYLLYGVMWACLKAFVGIGYCEHSLLWHDASYLTALVDLLSL